jgi:hypothetical protein
MRLSLVLVLLPLVCPAQDPPSPPPGATVCANARTLLHASTPVEKAWGAHLVLTCQRRELISDLVNELDAIHLGPEIGRCSQDPQFELARVLLDALIQLGANVYAAPLLRFFPQFREEVLILILSNPGASADLRSLLGLPVHKGELIPVYNAMLARHSPGLAAGILSILQLIHTLHVLSPDQRSIDSFMLCGGSGPLPEPPGWDPRFPTARIYRIDLGNGASNVPLAAGPRPRGQPDSYYDASYWATTLPIGNDMRIRSCFGFCGPPRECQLPAEQSAREDSRLYSAYLAVLTGREVKSVSQTIAPETEIPWTTAEAYTAQAAEAMAAQRAAMNQLVQELVKLRLITRKEGASLPMRVQLFVDDQRQHGAEPLPALPPAFDVR